MEGAAINISLFGDIAFVANLNKPKVHLASHSKQIGVGGWVACDL